MNDIAREQLDPHRHAGLRIGPPAIADRLLVELVTHEIPAAAVQHPLFFAKRFDTGRFYVAALLAFEEGVPLFVDEGGEYRGYRAWDFDREGFYRERDRTVIDPSCRRFSAGDGEPLYDREGRPGARLQRALKAVDLLGAGLADTASFMDAMLSLKLIEPVDISLSFDDGRTIRLDGLFTVSMDVLRTLDDRSTLALFRSGYMQLAYAVNLSLRHVPVLARRQNERDPVRF